MCVCVCVCVCMGVVCVGVGVLGGGNTYFQVDWVVEILGNRNRILHHL